MPVAVERSAVRGGSSSLLLRAWLGSALLVLSACSGTTGGGHTGAGGGSASGGGSGGSGGGSDSSVGGSGGSGGSLGSGGSGGGSNGSQEVCDGIDNDGDGIIDNVDVGNDGVCDCLRVATIGFPGQWGQGDVFSGWLQSRSAQGVTAIADQVLTAELLAPFQVIIVQDVRIGNAGQSGEGKGIGRAYTSAEIDAVKQWVSNGGGLMTLTGYSDSSEITNVNSLLASFGVNYGSSGILYGGGGATAPVTHWATHPLTEGVTKVGADNGYPVQGGGTLIAWETQGQSDAARAVEFSKGKVFVWADEWITYNSEWTGHTDYQVARFWLNSLKWLSPINQCQVVIPDQIG